MVVVYNHDARQTPNPVPIPHQTHRVSPLSSMWKCTRCYKTCVVITFDPPISPRPSRPISNSHISNTSSRCTISPGATRLQSKCVLLITGVITDHHECDLPPPAQEMLAALVQPNIRLSNGHYTGTVHKEVTPLDDLAALGWLADNADAQPTPATDNTPPCVTAHHTQKTPPPPASLPGARVAIRVQEPLVFDEDGSTEKLLPGVHIGR